MGAGVKLTGFALGAALAGSAATWSLPGTLALAAGVELLAVPVGLLQAVRLRAGR